ncbi:beta-1,6-N-acetylglucosaminyltransferase [Caenorhabditis elegans]|uniref:Uncharacterized protein n=1 Tax=Caenorhabditis elegans TaxID=6239 RepID=A0A8S0XG47_CAEEL|nr:Uncharacterized protein CELE_T27F6.1 [Caenorhabditis elegans]CAB04881.4 Uncharacterized protein CELE_T27F6.1 [Caenorhabditis elegans]
MNRSHYFWSFILLVALLCTLNWFLYNYQVYRNHYWSYTQNSSFQEDIAKFYPTSNKDVFVYRRRPETENVNCGQVLAGDTAYLKTVTGEYRIKIAENESLNMSCEAVMDRILSRDHVLRPLENGVAFARVVYMDYELIEKHVEMSYHPQNSFCFAIDKKAAKEFKERMQAMASCLPNVLLLPDDLSVDSHGHNTNLAHYNCLRALINKPGWNYAILLQNHDLITKSVYELEKIFNWLGGANDVAIRPELGRLDKKHFKWDPMSLKLFRNESEIDPVILNTTLKFAKGAVQSSLSRAAVDWMTRTVDLTTFIDQWNHGTYGVDEQFTQAFQISDFLGMPGHFTDKCIKKGIITEGITRFAQWTHGDQSKCASKKSRHGICIMGIEHLSMMAKSEHLMFNKVLPLFDYSIIECTAELLFNRTFLGQIHHPLNEEYYSNMINVLYHKHHHEPNYTFNCDNDH